jgi:signal peptidase I
VSAVAETPAAKEKGVAHYIGLGIGGALLVFVLFLGAILIVVPKATGSIPLSVLTGSMRPGLPPGTLLVVQPVDTDDILIGDVVTYQIRSGDPAVITHRVTGISEGADGERTFTLQGDANSDPDEPVREVQVQGRLWYSVPFAGFVSTAVNGEARGWIVPAAAGALFAYAGWMVLSAVRGRRRRPGVPDADSAP